MLRDGTISSTGGCERVSIQMRQKRHPRGFLARLLVDRGTITSAPIPRRVIASQFPRQALSSQVIDSLCVDCLPAAVGSQPGVTSLVHGPSHRRGVSRFQDCTRERHRCDELCSRGPVALSRVRPFRSVSSLPEFQEQLSPHGSRRPAMLAAVARSHRLLAARQT